MDDRMSRRDVVGWSAAGALAAPFVGSASAAAAPSREAAAKSRTGKCSWTLAAPPGGDRKQFQDFILRELARTAGQKIPGASMVTVTLQTLGAYGATVFVGDREQPVDAVLEITAAPYAPVKEVNAYLLANCGHVQGWRVHPTLIRDSSKPVPLGAPSALPQGLIYLQRLDGTTPEHFDRNWYMHAGHLDGQEAESAQSRAYSEQRSKSHPGIRYIQNRMLEPITPVQWVVNGYTELTIEGAIPGPTPRYERHNGEEIFEEWPPRTIQGHEYRLI
jgi:hypothetical protein